MTRRSSAAGRLGGAVLLAAVLASCSAEGTTTTSTTGGLAPPTAVGPTTPFRPPTSTPSTGPTAGGLADGAAYRRVVPRDCTLRGSGVWVLPDPSCTPGALNPAVTPSTIDSTICAPGYSSRIRPPQSFTYDLKRSQMAAWGLAGSTSQTEEDHLVPLSLGGAPSDSANLWPEPGGIPNPKDRLEYRLYRLVCDHALGLREAQRAIATDWITAYQRYIGPTPGS